MGRIYAEGRQAPRGIIGVMNAEFLATVHFVKFYVIEIYSIIYIFEYTLFTVYCD